MTNEKQTDSFHWKNKLEALDSLPGESITNKNAAWEKLSVRLHERPGRNKTIWYWAAAGLLVAILVPWVIANKKENNLAATGPLQKQNKTISVPALQKLPVIVAVSASPGKKQLVKSIHTTAAGRSANKNTLPVTGSLLAANAGTAIETAPAAIINVVPPSASAPTLTTIAVVKKQLRVVHINEIETVPAANPEQLALSSHEQNSFKFKFGNSHPVNDRQEYAGMLKIPLTN